MKQSKSNLLTYLGVLLSDDTVLMNFVIDPITDAEGKYGLTKAERSVLRRTVANLSNKSLNGFTMARHLGSYRRSLRLLQNVLHNVGSKMVQDTMTTAPNADGQPGGSYTFSVIYNLPSVANGPVDFTCKPNATVEQYGGPYAVSTPAYTVSLPNPNPTIQEVMDEVNKVYFGSPVMPYTTVTTKDGVFVKSLIPLSTYAITADLSNPCYNLDNNPTPDFVFWFYSINGRANPGNSGDVGKSFTEFLLNPNDTVYWQLIAPDTEYGFYPCVMTEGNAYALSTSTSRTVSA